MQVDHICSLTIGKAIHAVVPSQGRVTQLCQSLAGDLTLIIAKLSNTIMRLHVLIVRIVPPTAEFWLQHAQLISPYKMPPQIPDIRSYTTEPRVIVVRVTKFLHAELGYIYIALEVLLNSTQKLEVTQCHFHNDALHSRHSPLNARTISSGKDTSSLIHEHKSSIVIELSLSILHNLSSTNTLAFRNTMQVNTTGNNLSPITRHARELARQILVHPL